MFKTKITRARFVYSPFTAETMAGIGQVLADSIKARIQRGENVNDQAAKALNKAYVKAKLRRGRSPIRDWTWRGKTLGSLKVKTASENRVVIGFTNDEADKIAHINNLREKAFGISPKDREALLKAVDEAMQKRSPVGLTRAA